MILLHGTSCRSDFLQRVINQKASAFKNQARVYPRQTNAQIECVNGELDDALRGESSGFIEECKDAALNLQFIFTTTSQSSVDAIGETFCTPECGNAILAAIEACLEDEVSSRSKQFFIDMCGTNADGDTCYERYINARSHVSSIGDCYEDFESSGQCRSGCRSELNDAVDDQGCCINVYYDFFPADSDFDPRELHRSCDVDIPDPCDNSPLSGSVSRATIATVITAVIFYAALS